MPELPEVEVLVRHLRPQIRRKKIRKVIVRRERVLAGTPLDTFIRSLEGASFRNLSRRGKYLLFELTRGSKSQPFTLLGHLGMTGRMYLLPKRAALPKHAAVVFDLGKWNFVFEDTRYFGRLTLETTGIERLGREPLDNKFTADELAEALKSSKQPIKVKLLDQSLIAGLGNIYASEALFLAGVSPKIACCDLSRAQVARLWKAIRRVLRQAIRSGSTVPLDYAGSGSRDGLFYFGRADGTPANYEERLRVYDRAGKPCLKCGSEIKRVVQGSRSTFYCAVCQAS